MALFENDIEESLKILNNGGLILYPTDTVWGIGCDATNEQAVKKVYDLKKRSDTKSMIVLLASEGDILKHVAAPDPGIFDFLDHQTKPTTVIFGGALHFAENLMATDGTIGIRVVKDEFCRHLIKRFRKPLVSTSANLSGFPTPGNFKSIDDVIKSGVDYVVKWRQTDISEASPSKIVAWNNGQPMVLRD
jgi:L-threonylcarbamoyladenylate synthase